MTKRTTTKTMVDATNTVDLSDHHLTWKQEAFVNHYVKVRSRRRWHEVLLGRSFTMLTPTVRPDVASRSAAHCRYANVS